MRTHEGRRLRVVVHVLELEASLSGENTCAREQVQVARSVDVGVRQQHVGDVSGLHTVRSKAAGDGVPQQAKTSVDLNRRDLASRPIDLMDSWRSSAELHRRLSQKFELMEHAMNQWSTGHRAHSVKV